MPQVKTTVSGLLKEPLLHFLLLGLCIFLFAQWRAAINDENSRTITVDAELVQYLQNLYNVQFGNNPDAQTLERLIQSHIRDEVLFREAVRLGLAQQDEIVRRRMVQKLEFLIQDNETVGDPDTATLETWYASHIDDYQQPATASFQHLYFSIAGGDTTTAQSRALDALESVNSGTTVQGDRFALQSAYAEQTEAAVRQNFGLSEFSGAVFSAPVGIWSGPYASGYGLHLLKVDAHSPALTRPFTAVHEAVLRNWRQARQQDGFDQRLAQLLQTYTVLRTQ